MNNRAYRHIVLAVALTLAVPCAVCGGEISLPLGGRINKPVRSFQEIRQAHVVHQKWDFSCGSAALSTLLTYYYNDNVSESAIVTSILHCTDPKKIKARGGFSFLDLKRFVESRGYRGEGYFDLTLDELMKLGAPVNIWLH